MGQDIFRTVLPSPELEGLSALALAFSGEAIIPFLKFRSTLDFFSSQCLVFNEKSDCVMINREGLAMSCAAKEMPMAKRPAPRTPPEDQSFLDKLRSSLGNLPPKGDPSRRKFHFSFGTSSLLFSPLFPPRLLPRPPGEHHQLPIFKHYVNDGKVKDLVLRTDQITASSPRPRRARRTSPSLPCEWRPRAGGPPGPEKHQLHGAHREQVAGCHRSWILRSSFSSSLWRFLMGRMAGGPQGVLSVGKARAKIYAEREVEVRFDDVGGDRRGEAGARGNRRVPQDP